MKYFIIYIPSGKITQHGIAEDIYIQAVEPDESVIEDVDGELTLAVDGGFIGDYYYILNGVAVARPNLRETLPEAKSIATDTDWIIADVPDGTVVVIDGVEVGTVGVTGLTLSFALAGVWQVVLNPPFPSIAASCEVTVT